MEQREVPHSGLQMKLTNTSPMKRLIHEFPISRDVDWSAQVPCNNHVDKRRQQSYCLQKKTPFATNDDSINYHLRLEYFPNASVSSLAKVWSWRGAFPSFQSTKWRRTAQVPVWILQHSTFLHPLEQCDTEPTVANAKPFEILISLRSICCPCDGQMWRLPPVPEHRNNSGCSETEICETP